MTIANTQMGMQYVKTCCLQRSSEKFGRLIDKNVVLLENSNFKKPVLAKGFESVMALFNQSVFDLSKQWEIQAVEIAPIFSFGVSKVEVRLDFHETKEPDSDRQLYRFRETTILSLEKDATAWRIKHIEKRLDRSEWKPQPF